MAKNYMVLYGKNSVHERLKTRPDTIRKIFVREGFKEPDILSLIASHNIALERLGPHKLQKMQPAKDVQGIIARVAEFEYVHLDDLLNRPLEERPTLMFLDRVNDPQNLGTMIRTAACFGGFTVVIPRHEACPVNETVLHVASGGENYVPVAMVSNMSQAVRAAKDHGYWIVGAVVDDDAEDITRLSLSFPLGLVLGSEGSGIRYGLEKHLDFKAKIPMKGAPLSFNVSMACAIFCHEIAKRRGETR
jgi:23S rRNA (guanosine2251-2'-O)-methyltransferase